VRERRGTAAVAGSYPFPPFPFSFFFFLHKNQVKSVRNVRNQAIPRPRLRFPARSLLPSFFFPPFFPFLSCDRSEEGKLTGDIKPREAPRRRDFPLLFNPSIPSPFLSFFSPLFFFHQGMRRGNMRKKEN